MTKVNNYEAEKVTNQTTRSKNTLGREHLVHDTLMPFLAEQRVSLASSQNGYHSLTIMGDSRRLR